MVALPEQQAPRRVTLAIHLDLGTGGVRVEGPINDRILCYGMLEVARDQIKDFDPAKAAGALQIVKAGLAT